MNKELLFALYRIYSPSNGEKKMRKFIKQYIRKNCGSVKIVQDDLGNLFCTKGESETYPCLAAHLDQVQRKHSKDFECIEGKDVVFGYSAKSRELQGLGADDKNGIFICLECLKKYDILKVAFFVGEEIGCVGSNGCDLGFFKDCRFIIEPDRMNGYDLITSMFVGDVCSKEFFDAISLAASEHHYTEDVGSITDVGSLVERGVGISCLNLSCGYYDSHTDKEFTVLSELENCLDMVCYIVENLTDVYPYEYEDYFSMRGYNRGYDIFDDPYETRYEWDEDYDIMYDILMSEPKMTFEELVGEGGWLGNFYTDDLDILRDIYDSVKSLFEKYSTDVDELPFPEPKQELKKVS